MSEILGKIHSIESCGTVDGPGIRFVIFTQGCPLRCQYCHNPDSWEYNTDNLKTVEEILTQYDGVKEFCTGGITVTGGEPLVQIDFVTKLFKKAQEKGIHTALDTSGLLFNRTNTGKIETMEAVFAGGDCVTGPSTVINAIAAGKEAIADKLTGTIVKEIYVPGRIINIVQK